MGDGDGIRWKTSSLSTLGPDYRLRVPGKKQRDTIGDKGDCYTKSDVCNKKIREDECYRLEKNLNHDEEEMRTKDSMEVRMRRVKAIGRSDGKQDDGSEQREDKRERKEKTDGTFKWSDGLGTQRFKRWGGCSADEDVSKQSVNNGEGGEEDFPGGNDFESDGDE